MVSDFTSEPTDFAGLYTDPSAPKDQSPAELLYQQLAGSGQQTATTAPATKQAPSVAPSGGPAPVDATKHAPSVAPSGTGTPDATKQAPSAGVQGATPAAAAAPQPQQQAGNPSSVLNPANDSVALLARLTPLGIKSLSELKGKSEAELRKLSVDAVSYESRQSDLAKHFFKNPDGSWDFSKGPDGRPTGLDGSGHVIQPGATPTPAAKPAQKAPAKKPAAKKPAPKKRPAPKRAPARHNVVRHKPRRKPATAPRPAPRPRVAPRVAPKPAARPSTLSATTRRAS